MITSNRFMLKNISMTFLSIHLSDGFIELKPRETAGPFEAGRSSDHVERLCRSGVLAKWDAPQEKEPPAAAAKPRSRTMRTND